MSARRLQRQRTRGWKKPAGAVYVGRPTKWGNPYDVRDMQRELVVQAYEADLRDGKLPVTIDDVIRELRGKDLLCWCPIGQPCHADVLLRIANSDEEDFAI